MSIRKTCSPLSARRPLRGFARAARDVSKDPLRELGVRVEHAPDLFELAHVRVKDYNVLFREHDGTRSAAQVKAFKDTWEWAAAAAHSYHEVVEGGGKASEAL